MLSGGVWLVGHSRGEYQDEYPRGWPNIPASLSTKPSGLLTVHLQSFYIVKSFEGKKMIKKFKYSLSL